MIKRGANNTHLSQSNNNINIDLQLNLLNTWTKFNVADYYQNVFLVHLDELTPSQAELAIRKEIAQTLEKKSPYFQLLKLQKQRNNIIHKLQEQFKEAEQKETQPLLNKICLLIKQLRQVNLIAAQHILKMETIFHCNNYQSTEKQMEYYDSMLYNLDSDNQFLKESPLSNHLQFDQGYDPFLMYDYQRIHRNRDESIHPSIKQLFNVNISYAYRLMKTKSVILQLRALANQRDPGIAKQIKLPSERFKQNRINFQRNSFYLKGNTLKNNDDVKIPVRKSLPTKLEPLSLHPATHTKSRTTIYRDNEREDRPESDSITELNQKYRPKKIKKQTQQPPSRSWFSYLDTSYQKKRNKQKKLYYQISPKKQGDLTQKVKQFKYFPGDNNDNCILLGRKGTQQLTKPYKYKATVGQIYKSLKLDLTNRSRQQTNRAKLRTQPQQNPYSKNHNPYVKDIYRLSRENKQVRKPLAKKFYKYDQPQVVKLILTENVAENNQHLGYTPKHKQVIHYNPVIKQEYGSYEALPRKQKYDFTPPKRQKLSPKFQNQVESQSEQQENGLIYQAPISKYNLKRKSHKKNQEALKQKQQSQTILAKHQPITQQIPKKHTKKEVLNTDSDQTVQENDIIYERVSRPISKPPLRQISKQYSSTQPQQKYSKTTAINNSDNKEIKMMVGKATVEQAILLLKKYKLQDQYLNSFDVQKTIAWIKYNQTYLSEFTINNQTTVIALCSPIPNIGIALKLWATVNNQLNFNTRCTLFNKYIDFIQKSATSEKILFSGKSFEELQKSQFTMKRQNLYQRSRRAAATNSKSQFQPFLYIECSNLKFTNKTKNKKLFSQDIEQFTIANSWSADFMKNVNNNNVPSAFKPLIKFDQNLQSFQKVNQILTSEKFDNYEASSIKASYIALMRFCLNTSLRSTFIAQDNCFKFAGTVLHQKDRECVVSIGLNKNNGVIYFGKSVSFSFMKQIAKRDSTTRAYFTVAMFNKKMYGKIPEVEDTCYGNWQINLTWQDQIQGRIKHNMKQSISFGPQTFKVLIELQKTQVIGFQVNKQDFI